MADFEKINRSIDAGQDVVQASFESTVDTQDDEIGLKSFVKNVDDFQAKIEKLKISDDKKLAIFGDLDVFFKTEVITHLPLENVQQMEEIGLALEQKLAELDEEAAPKQGTQNEKKVSDIVPDFGLDLLQQTVAGIKDSFEDAQALEAAKKELLNNGIEGKTIEQNRATVEACQRQLERLGVQIKVQSEKITALNKILSSENLAEAVRHNSSVAANTTDIISQGIHIMNMARDKSAKINESIQTTEKEIKKILDLMYVSAYFEAKQSGDSERVDRILIAAFDRLGADIPPQLKDVVEAAKMRAADAAARSDASDNAVFDALYYSGNYAAALKLFAQKNKENATLGEGLLKYSASEISEAFNESTTTRAKETAEASHGIEKNSPAGKKLADGYVRLLFPQDTKANRYGLRLGRVLTLAKKLPDGTIAVSCFDASGQLRRLKDDVSFSVSPADVAKSEKDEKFIQENVDKVMAKMPSFKALSKAANTVQSKFEPMQKLFVAGKEGHMPADYVENVKNLARVLKADNGMDDLKANLAAAKEDLAILRQIPAGQRGKFEQQLEQMEAAYSKAIKIIENDTVNDFCKKIISDEFTEDTLVEWIATEGTVMLSTIVGAVLATALTFGAGGIVVASAAGALGGIVGSEVGHVVAEKVSGHEYRSRLGTTLMGGKVWNHTTGTFEKLTATDLATMYGGDFAQNFVSTLTIVGLGKMANGVLLKFAEANLQNPGVKGTLARISELVFNLKPVEIDLLKKTGKLEKIFHHLIAPVGEEVGEEGISIALAQLNNDYADMVSLFFAMRGGRGTLKHVPYGDTEVPTVTNSEEAMSSSASETVSNPSERRKARARRAVKNEARANNPEYAARVRANYDILNTPEGRPALEKSLREEGILKDGESITNDDFNELVAVHEIGGTGATNLRTKRGHAEKYADTKNMTPGERAQWRRIYEHALEEGFCGSESPSPLSQKIRTHFSSLRGKQSAISVGRGEQDIPESGWEIKEVNSDGTFDVRNGMGKAKYGVSLADLIRWNRRIVDGISYDFARENQIPESKPSPAQRPVEPVAQEVGNTANAKKQAGGFVRGVLDRLGIKPSPERKTAGLLKDMEGRGDPYIMQWLREGTSERDRPMTPELRLEVVQMYKQHLDDIDTIRKYNPNYIVPDFSGDTGRAFTVREKCEITKRDRQALEAKRPSSQPPKAVAAPEPNIVETMVDYNFGRISLGKGEKFRIIPGERLVISTTTGRDIIAVIERTTSGLKMSSGDLQHSILIPSDGSPITWGRNIQDVNQNAEISNKVSYEHIKVSYDGKTLTVTDNSSTNGTSIAGAERVNERVARERQTVAVIGDLGGSHGRMEDILRTGKFVDSNGRWAAGERTLVFVGDIVGDRTEEGFDCLLRIRALRKQARAAGGDIKVVAGNHEDFLLSYLTSKGGIHGNGLNVSRVGALEGAAQGQGLLELTQFTGDRKMITDFETAMRLGRLDPEEALNNMRRDPRGREILEELCDTSLAVFSNDTLTVHTDPTNGMLEILNQYGINDINNWFQSPLRGALIHGEQFDPQNNYLVDTFLATNNRTFAKSQNGETGEVDTGKINLDPVLLAQLRAKGVRRIVFGHSNLGSENRRFFYEGIEFVSVDQHGNDGALSAAELAPGRTRAANTMFDEGLYND